MRFINITCGALTALGSTMWGMSAASELKKSDQKPNVLLIIVDDWGARDLSFAGSKFYETPCIDELARQSTSFSQAYVAYPRSVPSRYSLITGRHCARPQDGSKLDTRKVDSDSYCIAEPFKAGGYGTFFIGKWHLSDGKCMPENKGFDINIGGGKAGETGSHFAPFNRPGESKPDRLIVGMDDAEKGEYLTDYMTRKTVDYLKSEHKKPFFAVCSFYAVHTPLQGKPDLVKKYEEKKLKMSLGIDPMMKEEAGIGKTQQDNALYAAMIESVDQGVSRMIKALKESGKYDNTIIVIVSDNGGLSNRGKNQRDLATTNAPYRAGKGHLYEGGIKVPLLIHLPKQKKSMNIDNLVAGYDLLPTLTDLCSVPVSKDAGLDGMSLEPLLLNQNSLALTKRSLFWHKASERPESTGDYLSTAVRSGDYKLIDFYGQGRVELYNIKSDPGETKNLISENPEIARKLMDEINVWRKDAHVIMGKAAKDMNKKAVNKKGKKEIKKVIGDVDENE